MSNLEKADFERSGGQLAYEAFNKAAYGSAVDQAPVPWPDLQPSIKAAWTAAAEAVINSDGSRELEGFHDEENRDRIGADVSSLSLIGR